MYLFKKIGYLSLLVLFAACTVRPLYYQNSLESENSKSFIQVSAITKRLGQELRNMLTERLHFIRSIENPISVNISLTTETTEIGRNPDLSASVKRVTVTAKTTISNKKGFSKTITTEKSDIVTIPFSIYASIVNEEDIKRKILREIANDIIQRITALQKDLQ
ncbi:MAG: LPS assembly lipoprotein LptE [Alphaproteobacteria bacterium]|nr:LPS assembly lipoprotein LptE [Alphaproteobacteria bacterium]